VDSSNDVDVDLREPLLGPQVVVALSVRELVHRAHRAVPVHERAGWRTQYEVMSARSLGTPCVAELEALDRVSPIVAVVASRPDMEFECPDVKGRRVGGCGEAISRPPRGWFGLPGRVCGIRCRGARIDGGRLRTIVPVHGSYR
jgi:hypothetical protein